MADFTKFKVGSTSYNVKDANAGRSLSVNGSDLSLKNAAGTAISTVSLPSDTIYTVEVRYTDTTITGQASNPIPSFQAGTGTWSVTITPSLPAGKTLFDVNRVFTGFCSFPNADSGYQNHLLFNTDTNNNYPTFLIEDDNLTHSVGAIITVFVAADGSYVMDYGFTLLSSGGGGGGAASVIKLCSATTWPLQQINNLRHLISQGDPATLLAIEHEYNGAIVPVSAYSISVNQGGYTTNYSDLAALVAAETVATPFTLTVWLVEGFQSNQMHQIEFAGVIDTNSTITLQGVTSLTPASIIG